MFPSVMLHDTRYHLETEFLCISLKNEWSFALVRKGLTP